jgi:spore germination cell wall hydrolase CwlJ-like protein
MGFFMKATFIFAIVLIIPHDALTPVPLNGTSYIKLNVAEPELPKINYDDVLWMAINIYYEARNQSSMGKIAVGIVTLNRMRQDSRPTVHAVVTEPRQFSWYNQYLRTAKIRMPKDSEVWQECLRVAEYVLLLKESDDIMKLLNGVTHYHTTRVHPNWRRSMEKVVQIDDHIFYRKK